MFCENCGNQLQQGHKFCTKCGHSSNASTTFVSSKKQIVNSDERWWHRLLKVVYIFLYLQILWIVPAVWSINSTSYVGYYGGQYQYRDTPAAAFWYSVLALIISILVLKLVKLTASYIFLAHRPDWAKEFKKIF